MTSAATTISDSLQSAITDIKAICDKSTSTSQYFPFGGEGYKSCVRHYFESSTEIAAGAVQPGSVSDLCDIVKVIKKYQVPFAIKSGGHATNPGLSSTVGIQISMCRFNKIVIEQNTTSLSSNGQTQNLVHVGAGCLFDELYREVVPTGLNIVGGSSIGGVGVAGWHLGGGYSLKTNRYGLGIDNIMKIQIVLPNGTSKEVSVLSTGDDKELFEAVKGGGNNFGFVTQFTLKAHVQDTPVYGSLFVYEIEEFEEVKSAIANFAKQTDPRACIVGAYRYSVGSEGLVSKMTVECFYEGPKPSTDPFKKFTKILHTSVDGGGDSIGRESNDTKKGTSKIALGRSKLAYPGSKHYDAEHSDEENSDAEQEDSFSELHEFPSYAHFDQHFSLIRESFTTNTFNAKTIDSLPKDFTLNFNKLSTMQSVRLANKSASSDSGATLQTLSPESADRIKRAMTGVGENPRGRWGCVMIDVFTKKVIDEIERQASRAARQMIDNGGTRVIIDMWPFTSTMFDNSTAAAWPHVKDYPNGPVLAYFLWQGKENDAFWINTMQTALSAIKKQIKKSRGKKAAPLPVYCNTSLDSTTVKEIYANNLDNLKKSRQKFDPDDLMSLTGGFRIPLPGDEAWSD